MKAIVLTAPHRLELLDLPDPEPGDGMVRIRTCSVGICATDLQMIAGWQRTGFPAIPGHEWSGVVDAVGPGVAPHLVGQPCVAENILKGGGEVGFEFPGGYAQFFCTEASNLHFLPGNEAIPLAPLIEPLAVCIRGLARLRAHDPAPVLIFGDGPIGLLFLVAIRSRGFNSVDLAGREAYRMKLAQELGARQVINFQELANQDQLLAAAYPYIVEASGSPDALAHAVQIAPHAARILFLGDYAGARASFRWTDLLHREIELIGSNASAGAWQEALQLATQGKLPLEKLISHRFPYHRFGEAIDLAANHKDRCMKIVLDW